MKANVEAIKSRLFAADGANVFAVLDGASAPGLLEKLASYHLEHECLYRGELQPDLAEAAPYLVRLEAGEEFTDWVLEQGWGNHWGVFAVSASGFRELRQHIRRILVVHDSAGKPLYFRFYDPRVLGPYLATCNKGELETMFGPVTAYWTESEDSAALLRFRREAGKLTRREEKLTPA